MSEDYGGEDQKGLESKDRAVLCQEGASTIAVRQKKTGRRYSDEAFFEKPATVIKSSSHRFASMLVTMP